MSSSSQSRPKNPAIDLIAGGTAGLFEALCCHPLDTIKVRMQLYKKNTHNLINNSNTSNVAIKSPGFLKTGSNIIQKESFVALYKGLGAVCIGIVPKMAIRFSSYEYYKSLLMDKKTNKISTTNTFISGVGAGITEAVLIVNPMEVVKIRLQAQQHHSMSDPLNYPKYRNAIHATYLIIKEEGFKTLYRGVTLTALRQATNQGVNFTVYSKLKELLTDYHQKNNSTSVIPSWQTSLIGLISGALGPLSNAPLDTIKTRMQRETGISTESALKRMIRISSKLIQEEGSKALYKGITPRIMRVAPGQAVTFTVYEKMKTWLYDLPNMNGQTAIFDE